MVFRYTADVELKQNVDKFFTYRRAFAEDTKQFVAGLLQQSIGSMVGVGEEEAGIVAEVFITKWKEANDQTAFFHNNNKYRNRTMHSDDNNGIRCERFNDNEDYYQLACADTNIIREEIFTGHFAMLKEIYSKATKLDKNNDLFLSRLYLMLSRYRLLGDARAGYQGSVPPRAWEKLKVRVRVN